MRNEMRSVVYKKLSVALSLAALNLVIGSFVSFFKLPLYLDSIGIFTATILLGWRYGVICALLTVSAGSLLINPYLVFYAATSIGIATTVYILRRLNLFRNYATVIISGIVVAVVSAMLSAPITAYLFEGSTLSGTDALTAYFMATGRTLLNSVLLAGISSEPVDKIIVALASYQLLKSLPLSFIEKHRFNRYRG